MNDLLLYVLAFGALVGGADHMLGNRFGYGERFQEAFRLLGPIGLSMAGILCLAPILSQWMGNVIVPVFTALKLDPGMFGSILAIDMGGYQMAMDLAADPRIGQFSGIIVSAIFGCTLVFTIPVGMGAMAEGERPHFTRGILIGLVTMPGGILAGGLMWGLSVGTVLWNCLPLLFLCGLLLWGLLKKPESMTRLFRGFSRCIQLLASLGLTLGAVQYITGLQFVKTMIPLEEAMEVVCSIAIMMLGSIPLAELLQRLLKRPFAWVRKHTGLNEVSTTGLLIGMVSVVPALAMFPRMDERGRVVNGAFLVCAASAFAAHLGFALSTQPQMAAALLTAKLLGGVLGVILALAVTAKK